MILFILLYNKRMLSYLFNLFLTEDKSNNVHKIHKRRNVVACGKGDYVILNYCIK